MPDETPTPLPVPAPEPDPIHPSTIQVVSATIQNVVVSLVVAYAWLVSGKLDTTVALGTLLAVVGIDFANRVRVPGSRAAAVAFGATGMFSAFRGLGGVILIVASALSLGACGGAAYQIDLTPYKEALVASKAVYEDLCPDPIAKIKPECEKAHDGINAAIAAYNVLEKIAEQQAQASDAGHD